MNKKRKSANLQDQSLQKIPFVVPEGYFESFSERLQKRINEERESSVPVRRIFTSTRFRVALAAAVVGLALISFSITMLTRAGNGDSGSYLDIALLEQMQLIEDDSYLIELMDSESEALDAEDAFATQAMDYLAVNDVEMVFLFE